MITAEIRFEHEFTVDVPLEQAWRALAGADAVAAALPNAQLRAVDGLHTGRIQLDPRRNLACDATISAVDQDEDEHVATVSLHGRQVDGPAIGSVVVRNRLSEAGSSTKVRLTAEVLTTGHDPGNGFQAGAQSIFDTVIEGLERRALEGAPEVEAVDASTSRAAPSAALPSVVRPSWVERITEQKSLVGGAAGLVLAAVVLRRMRRGRRRF
jgi:carbon monoxide dehydrogenase subunit G